MASNDEAVAFTCKSRRPGINAEVLTQALAYRQAGADPDALFAARTMLPEQIKSCAQVIAR